MGPMKRLCSFSSGNSQPHIPFHLSAVLNKHSMPDISAFQKSSACSCAWVFDTSRSKEDRAFWVECCKVLTPRKACQERSVAKRPDDDPLRLAQVLPNRVPGCIIIVPRYITWSTPTQGICSGELKCYSIAVCVRSLKWREICQKNQNHLNRKKGQPPAYHRKSTSILISSDIKSFRVTTLAQLLTANAY